MRALSTGADTIVSVLTRRSTEQPSSPFMVFDDLDGRIHRRSYAEMATRASLAAEVLARHGIGRGDRVHVHLPNCPEFFDVWFGAAWLGAVIVPTNPLLTADELAYVVGHAGTTLSVTRSDLVATVRAASGSRRVLVTGEPPEGTESFEDEIGRATPAAPAGPAPSDVAAVLYTSGTTSRPKGVLVTHANYLHVGEVVAQHLRITPADRTLIALPLFHANAQYYSTMSALVTGSSLIVMARFSASRWAPIARIHRATLASLFAAPIRMLLAQPRDENHAHNDLRAVVFSQNVSEAQLEEFEQRFACPLLQLYGMTETIAPPTLNPLYAPRRNMSIGRPTLGARLRVVTEDGIDASNGEVGELLVGGDPGTTLMAGYLGDEDATREALVDGWLHTGDNVRVDEDGYFHFVDRAKDMIKRAGENVAASEIESAINDHPAVFESAVIGVPDAIRDEAIQAHVVAVGGTNLTEEDLIQWCTSRLASFKVPGSIFFVDELPRTSVGKIQKDKLRQNHVPEGGKVEDSGTL